MASRGAPRSHPCLCYCKATSHGHVLLIAEFSWSVTYDAICCALEHRADIVALDVRASQALQNASR